jgi:group I intron endonuclease
MCYIGQAKSKQNISSKRIMMQRWNGHCCDTFKHNSQLDFHKAIREHGKENFEHEVLDEGFVDPKETDYAEQYYILRWHSKKPLGYNMNRGGNGNRGYKRTPEQCKRHGDLVRGKPTWNAGKTNVYTDESRNLMRQAALGRKRKKESCEKQKVTMKIRNITVPDACRQKSIIAHLRPVNQYDLNGVFIKTFTSIKEAQLETGAKLISSCCRRVRKCSGNFIWRYVDDIDQIVIPIQKKKIKSKESKTKRRHKIQQLDLKHNFIRIWNTLQEAAHTLKISKGNICSCTKGNRPQAGGFIWRYVVEE